MVAEWFTRRLAAARERPDAGVSAVEMVILAPLMLMFVLLLVAFGLLVRAHSSLDGAARDAARAGSLQRNLGAATSAARDAAVADAANICAGGRVNVTTGGSFVSGGMFTVHVSCEVRALKWLGFKNLTTSVDATSAAPIDTFRRTG